MEKGLPKNLVPSSWKRQHGENQPHAPAPTHPDDIPFDPEQQRRWEQARGIHKNKKKSPEDDGIVDFNNSPVNPRA